MPQTKTKITLLGIGLLIIIAITYTVFIHNPAHNFIRVEKAILDNGMEIYVVPYDRAPTVTHMIWYRIGGADEPNKKSGIAHLFEHLMFKATKNYPAGAFSQKVAELGGQHNAMTSQDFTVYYQRIPKQHLETVMSLEADRMVNLVLSEDDFQTERNVVLEERSLRVDSNPQALANEQISARLYQDHPYGIPVIGWRDEIENMPYEAAQTFYQNYYVPDQAIMVVVGDTTLESVLMLAKKHFGSIPAREAKRPDRPIIDFTKPLKEKTPLTFTDPRFQQSIWQHRTRLMPFTNENEREMAALTIGIQILGSGANSRLYSRLIRQDKTANYVNASLDPIGINAAEIRLFAIAKNNDDLDKMEQAIHEEIEQMRRSPPSKSEVLRAANVLASENLYAMDGQSDMAFNFGYRLVLGNELDDLTNYPKMLFRISPQEVQDALSKHMDADQSVTAYLSPSE